MNGTLAWMQTTGMPMRPAMSDDDDRRDPADRGSRGRARRPARTSPTTTRPGVPTRVTATVVDAETGEPVDGPDPQPRGVDAPHRHPRGPRHVRPRPPRADRTPRRAGGRGHVPDRRDATSSTPSSVSRARWPTCTSASWSPSPATAPEPVDPGRRPADRGRRRRRGRARRGGRRRGAQRPALRVHRRRHRRAGRRPAAVPGRSRPRRGDARRRRRRSPTSTPRSRTTRAARCSPSPGQTFGPELDVHAEFDTPGHLPAVGPVPARRRRRPHGAVHRRGVLTPPTAAGPTTRWAGRLLPDAGMSA